MKDSRFITLIAIASMLLVNCGTGSATTLTDVVVPEVRIPGSLLDRTGLQDYILAFCWRSPTRDAFGRGRTDMVLMRGSNSQSTTITYPTQPLQSAVSLGCFGREHTLRVGGYGVSWRPMHNELSLVAGASGPPGDNFYFVGVHNNLTIELPERELWEHEKYFRHPTKLAWSPDGEWLATIGENANEVPWQNVWIYNVDSDQAIRVTDITQPASYVSAPAWSSNGQYIAVSLGSGRSGIGIIRLTDLVYTEVSNRNQSVLHDWRYQLGETVGVRDQTITLDPKEWLQIYLYANSQPMWVDQNQRIVFIAPASDDQVTLFVANADGTDLRELLPGLAGLIGLPKLAPGGRRLAFVRYPGWDERNRVEVAVVDLTTNKVTSLAVIPAPGNGDELYISGLDWTPDGKHLAFSSNHEGQSDIYVISADGQAWVNLTAQNDGDAVNPVWR